MSSASKQKKNRFGATSPPFIDYLKEILRRYPDGGQILKELIQNADDAGASAVVFIYDERHYGTDSLWTKDLGKYQGPALYAFNDAEFTEEDWEGIQRVGRSIKQDDPTKAGRFGIGFNSVYHITDLPCVFSSEHLAIFDPQKKMFGEDEEGYRWSLNDEEDRASLLKLKDQFQPFQNTVSQVNSCSWEKVISEEQYFKGTLFRFPLRNEASEISDNLYDSTKVTQLFDNFIADSDISLLFLRNVTSITLLHIDTNGLCNNRLKVLVSNHFTFFNDLSHIKWESFDRKTCFKTVSHISQQTEEKRSQWLVTTCLLKQGYIPEIDSLASKLSFYPQADAAFQLDEDRSLCNGRLSCFLPLPKNEPNKTALPIHINACFGLTDNRRFIKWQEEDQKNDESAKWNELLTKYIIPHVYLMMILDAVQLSGNSVLPSPTVYNLWPDLSMTIHKERWREVATDTLKGLFKYKIFHRADDEQIWVSASDAVFPVNDIRSDTMSAISRLLIAEGENLVTVQEHVLKDVQEIFPESDTLTWVTPSFVRDVLHRSEVDNLSKDDKYALLEFTLSDEKYTELEGLKLLPLSDGTFTSFGSGEQNTVLIDNEKFPKTLLPFCKERFLPNDLSHFCIMQLRKLAARNIYKIINLDVQPIVALTKKHLPMNWKGTQGHVTWKPSEDDHPPKSWLAEFWKFLSSDWIELSSFIDMPLIPLEPLHSSDNSILLARLQSNTTLIFQCSTGSNLSENVQKLLKTVGCTVIKRDDCLRHHDIESYVLPASPRNVLQVFVNSNRDQVIKAIASASSHEIEELKVYLSSLDSLSIAEQDLLSKLPIFRMMSGKYVAVEKNQAVVSMTNPAIPNDLPIPDTIVQCANEADRRLLTLLNIELLDAAKVAVYLVDCIKTGSYQKGEEQTVMSWILNNGSILFSQSEQLLTKTKSVNFIQTAQGERKQTSNVFDPRNKTFQDLFEADFFPPPIYTKTQEMLQSLQCLGLKTEQKEISTANILQVIIHIEKICVNSPDKAFKKAHTLVRVLNENDFLSKFTKMQIGELMQRKWVPCENPEFLTGSICKNLKQGFYKPCEVRDSMYSSIVGYVMPLTSELTRPICNCLGFYEPPPAEKVLENLSALRSMVNANSDFQIKTKLHSIYKFMQGNIKNFRDLMATKCIPFIWNRSEFVSPGDIVLAYPTELDLSPYIKKVPEEFLQYEDLFTTFGVEKTLTDEKIEGILHDIKQRIDCRSPPHGNSKELKVSIAILDWMRKNEKILKESTPVPVMTQNKNFTMQSLSKTVFCDISAEVLDDLKQDNKELFIIHEEVLPLTARWFRVPFLSTHILKPQFIQAEQELFGLEQCGQSEPITQRIKNILKEYDEESDIFKELLQNAEDAGATTCKFLLDFRKHRDPPETLFDDGMALCNGPCLWIFNNELFSQDDWRNIVKVGSATKQKADMIGKFGLGFNSVYHISDIPSILSGKSLLILDPNVTHLKKHIRNKTNPGIKLDPFWLYKYFPGQFKSYEGIFDCDLSVQNSKKTYNGTLIKLPFRTLEEANKSEISSKVCDEECIRSFTNTLINNSKTHLLFLKRITFMSLQIVPENASTPPQADQIQTSFKISREVMTSFAVSNDIPLQEIKSTFRNSDITSHNITDVNRAQIVKIVQEHSERSLTQYWFLYSCFGMHKSLQMFQGRKEQEHVFSFPIGGIAVPLQRDAKTKAWTPYESLIGQAFCFLPLSIETGLPVHVNGTFAVTSNRKSLWETGEKSEWNKALLKDTITSAYITTLLELKKIGHNGRIQNYSYYTFWPNREKVSKVFLPLVESFYSAVVENGSGKSLDLFCNGNNWCSIDKVRFLNPKIEENLGVIAMEVFLNLGASYSCVVSLPSWVRQSFIDCGFKPVIEQRTINWPEFYCIVFKNLRAVDTHNINCLVLNAIDLNDPEVDDLMKSYPCIPTRSCEKLQFIKQLVNPSGKVACLYELEEGRFLEGTANDFLSPKRLQRLSDLGMLSDSLPLEDIIERVAKISGIWQQDLSKYFKYLQCLMELIKDSTEDVNSLLWDTLSQKPFLPALAPLVQQNKNTTVLKKPCEVYSDRCHNLVSMTEFTLDHSILQIHSHDPALKKLRVRTNPPIETVLQQLLEAHKHCDAFEETALLNIALSCYEYLNDYLLEQKDPNPIIDHAKSFPFIFIENHFVNVKVVARSEDCENKPYLISLPVIFSKFERLWDCLGVNKQFTKEQFFAALEEMKALYGSRPLSASDLQKCVAILMNGLYKIKDEMITDCLIPDEKGVLTYSKELRFNDSPWVPVLDGVKFSHDMIPQCVACHFGVVTTRNYHLNKHLDSLHYEEFGQAEKLTVRIKNIMDAYPSKKDILKELIQNADDAEANEIHFVWDKRHHKTEKIFGEEWELVQGPALCVYNNSTFSDADLQGIQQLGGGGKHGTLGKTGKYGLGFNSVYHLTDCPSILSGDKWLCISDPNLKYVNSLTKQSPGCKLSINNNSKKLLEDVYHTFLPEMFELNSGTMFRLPLRTEKMAEISEISRHTVTDHDMEELYCALTEDPEGLILFLKHITKIQFSEISEDGKEPKCYLVIEKKYTEMSTVSKETFNRNVRESLMSRTAEPCKTIYGVQISSANKQSQWVIAECYGFLKTYYEQKNNQDNFKVPHAALAACQSSSFSHTFTGRAFCSLPLPGQTGLPVHVNANFEVDSFRRDLWKDDGDSLKTDWNQSLKVNIISPLYADLLLHLCSDMKKDTPTPLAFLKTQLESSCLKYFPCISPEVDNVWHGMINEVYRSINQCKLPVIPTVHAVSVESSHLSEQTYTVTWCYASKPHSEKCPYFTNEDHDGIFKILDDTGMKLVPKFGEMQKIKDSFKSAGVNVAEITASTVIDFLKQRPLNNPSQRISGLPLPINQTWIKDKTRYLKLLSFCLTNANEKNVHDLNGLPLLLTQDQMLRVFDSKSPKLITRFNSLFQGHQEMFADMDVNKNHVQILHKGNFIKDLTIEIAATYLKPVLEQLLRQSLPDQRCQPYKAETETIKWLKELWSFFYDQEKSYQNENLNVLSKIKKHFDDSYILPVISPCQSDTCYLQTMRNISKVIQFNENGKIVFILMKLGFMKLDTSFFNNLGFCVKNLYPELMQTGDSSAVLGQVRHVSHLLFEDLSEDECVELQDFLQHAIRDCNTNSNCVLMLKSLPLFESISGKRERIDEDKKLFVLNSEHHINFSNLYQVDECDIIFLKPTPVNLKLAGCIKIQILNDLEFCVQFILPSVHMMEEAKLFDFLRLLMKLEPVDQRIVSALREVRFIRDIHGSLQVASYFYEDSVDLYKVMLSKERFVPKTFWNNFQREHQEQTLCDYHKAFAQNEEVVAISGSLINRVIDHHYLIWTSMPILPSEFLLPQHIEKMMDAGALGTPPLGQIAANMKNICESQCHTEELLETRIKVFKKSYAFLQSKEFDASQFSDLPIILVENGRTLVKACQAVFSLPDAPEFRPYLYSIPPNFVKFEDFFKRIGIEERPTIDQYRTVLKEIYSDSSDKDSLQANQQKTVKRVVQQLFYLLKVEQKKPLFQNNLLYLPSTDGKIYESSTLFFNDTVFQAARLKGSLETKLKLLENLDCCYLGNDQYEHQTLLQFLPKHVRPQFLSNVISENLKGTSVQCCDYTGECEFSGWFEKHLSSAAFLHGLICLIREENKGSVSHSEAARQCEEIFAKTHIICCKTFQTELLLDLEPLGGSTSERDVFVKKQQDGCSFYLKHNDESTFKVINEVNVCLTKEINVLLKNCLTTSLPVLVQLLLCDNMEDVEKTLSNHGIHNSGSKQGFSALTKPGCCIPEEWHDCLDMNFLNNFENGEYVGFSKDESGEYVYAIVIEQQINKFPARYKIQVGSDDLIEVSALNLYQFKRQKITTVSKGSTCTENSVISTSSPSPKAIFPETMEEIKRETDKSLNEIWKMSSEDKQKALKRLYLRWHPDKNPGNEELASEAFKYLQNRIEEIEKGKTAHSTSSNWKDFQNFYDVWNTEAQNHRMGRESFCQNYSTRHYNFWSYHRDTPRPNKGEAKRWYEQAQCDIKAAHNDTGGNSSEWCLFKVHQAVEKALIAAMYKKSGQHPNNCSITSLALQVSHFSSSLASLPNTLRQLTELGVDGKKTQYPNYHHFPHIPNKQFGVNNARRASDIAINLLEKIEEYIS
uniref:HEPN domain-containing protein n=1 Tax=Cyprinus carpio TaxID=7962 RepID=A0A8C2FWE3_CYPCA